MRANVLLGHLRLRCMATLTALDWIALGSEHRTFCEERVQSVNVKGQDFAQAPLRRGRHDSALCLAQEASRSSSTLDSLIKASFMRIHRFFMVKWIRVLQE